MSAASIARFILGQLPETFEGRAVFAVTVVIATYIFNRSRKWYNDQSHHATDPGILGMLLVGWDNPSGEVARQGPIGNDGSDKIGWSEVIADQFADPVRLATRVRLSILTKFAFFLAVPLATGQTIPVQAILMAAFGLILISQFSDMLDRHIGFKARTPRAPDGPIRCYAAGTVFVSLSYVGASTMRGTSWVFWAGLALVGSSLFRVALNRGSTGRARPVAAFGWTFTTIGLPLVYVDQMTNPIVIAFTAASVAADYWSARASWASRAAIAQ